MNRSTVEEIKKRIPIEELLASYVKLEKAGKSFKARCPFHNEKTASFFISPERGGYYCFGCGAKGDIFSFVEQFEGLDFRGALKLLAERAGVPLVFDKKADGERDKLFQIIEEATAYFEDQFSKSKEAKDYLESRGIKDETRKLFRIGWAPEGWSNLYNYLKGRKWDNDIIEKAGLAKKRDNPVIPAQAGIRASLNNSPADSRFRGKDNTNNFYDRFRGRVMFPIADSGGSIIAFSGRILKDDGKSAKYINSPDTTLYDKSSVLYGLDKAKGEIRRLDYTILVEGQMDLVMSHQAGIKNTVAASGTALADESTNKQGVINNLGLIRRLSPNVIIAFDSDSAGKKAAMRAAAIALKLGMDVKMADIQGGKDPADIIKEDSNKWKEVLRHTKPVIEFELNNILKDITDQRKISRAIQEKVFPLMANIEKQTDLDFFVKMIADRTSMQAGSIWDDLRIVKKRLDAETPAAPASNISAKTSSEVSKRIDLVERRLFGLLAIMESDQIPEAAGYREQLKKIAGDSYIGRVARADSVKSDLLFEAEVFFGADKSSWDKHMKELLFNFEEDVINEEIMSAMQELRTAEKAGNNQLVAEMATKCQVLSIRKAEINKKRRG